MIKLKKLRYPNRVGLDLTPMVDIVFLLIIFFMTSTTIIQNNNIKINLPKANNFTVNTKNNPLVLSINKENKLYIENTEVTWENLEDTLQSKFNTKEIKATERLTIKGDKSVDYNNIIRIMNIAKKIGIEKISLATSAEAK